MLHEFAVHAVLRRVLWRINKNTFFTARRDTDRTEVKQPSATCSVQFSVPQDEAQKDAVAQQISDIRDRQGTMEDFLRILKQQDGEVTAFSEKLWCGLLDYATAYADGRLTFTFKNGSTFEG